MKKGVWMGGPVSSLNNLEEEPNQMNKGYNGVTVVYWLSTRYTEDSCIWNTIVHVIWTMCKKTLKISMHKKQQNQNWVYP